MKIAMMTTQQHNNRKYKGTYLSANIQTNLKITTQRSKQNIIDTKKVQRINTDTLLTYDTNIHRTRTHKQVNNKQY